MCPLPPFSHATPLTFPEMRLRRSGDRPPITSFASPDPWSCMKTPPPLPSPDEARRVGPEKAALDVISSTRVDEDDGGQRGAAVDHEAAHGAASRTELEHEHAEVGPAAVGRVDLDLVHRVVREPRPAVVDVRARLCVAVHDRRAREVRQGAGDHDRVHSRAGDVERDGVQARVRVGVEDRLPERAGAAVRRGRDRVGVRHGRERKGERREEGEGHPSETLHGPPILSKSFPGWQKNMPGPGPASTGVGGRAPFQRARRSAEIQPGIDVRNSNPRRS